MATAAKKRRNKRAARRRKELIAGVVVLSVIFIALVAVAVVLFRGQAPQTVAKPPMEPLPQVQSQAKNPYSASDFIAQDGRMALRSGQGIAGIDVSRYQGDIDWQKVADSGVKFAFIRVGYRTYGSGEITADPNAQANYRGAKAAGLKVGVYFFSQAIDEVEAVEEASYVLDKIKKYKIS